MSRALRLLGFALAGVVVASCTTSEPTPEDFAEAKAAVMGDCALTSVSTTVTTGADPGAATITAAGNCGAFGAISYKYYIRLNGVWTAPCGNSYTASTTCNLTGLVAGTYRVQVWAKHGASAGPDAAANVFPDFTIQPAGTWTPCVNATVNATPTSPVWVGDQVSIAGAASCGAGPTQMRAYQRRAAEPFVDTNVNGSWDVGETFTDRDGNTTYDGAGSWNLLSAAWATSPYAWTSTAVTGEYAQFRTEVRGDPAGATVFSSPSPEYQIISTPAGTCTATSTTAAPNGGVVSQNLTFTGTSSCTNGATPEYRHLVRLPNLNWIVACEWQSQTTCVYSAPATAGSYRTQLWVRRSGGTTVSATSLNFPICVAVPHCATGLTCTNGTDQSCGGTCDAGYARVSGACVPTLTALTSSVALSPTFAPTTTNYTANVDLFTQVVSLTPTATAGATITINGTPVTSGATWDSPTLNLGATVFSVVVSEVGVPSQTYTITVNRSAATLSYLKASNVDAGDWFGVNVAIDGDTLVVGAQIESSNATTINGDETNNSATYTGAAYVFVRSGSTWSQQAYLKAANSGPGDNFGAAVAISGDTIVVGAYGEDSKATGVNSTDTSNDATTSSSGAAYVFVRSGTTWTQEAYLKASNTGLNDNFGASVAVSGDTVVVGAYLEDSNAAAIDGDGANNSAVDSGAAYVFTRTASVWTQQAYLKASNTDADDRFGLRVAVDLDTIVVGANFEDSNATGIDGDGTDNSSVDSGAAYVFTRAASVWTQEAYLKASNTGADDRFGTRVAVYDDTVVVGANFEDSNATGVNGNQSDNSATQSGAAYVFFRTGASWAQQAYLKASNTGADDRFGVSVGIFGDTIVVGAHFEDSNATGVNGTQSDNSSADRGAAYLYVRTGSTWSPHAYLKPSNAGAGMYFGFSTAISNDTIAVGAHLEDGSGADSGATYVFE